MTDTSLFECELQMNLESGLHARPAGILVKVASAFPCKIELEKNGQRKNAKSIMSLMSLGAVKGDTLKLLITGDGAQTAGTKIQQLFENGFQLEN